MTRFSTDTETLPREDVEIDVADDVKERHVPMYKVIFHNDDKTTMDFVVFVLMRFFNHEVEEAVKIMLEVHEEGQGVAGVYPFETAEFKRDQTISAARPTWPLMVTIEPDE